MIGVPWRDIAPGTEITVPDETGTMRTESVLYVEFQSWADHAEAEITRLRAALAVAAECMVTLKENIAKAEAAMEGEAQ